MFFNYVDHVSLDCQGIRIQRNTDLCLYTETKKKIMLNVWSEKVLSICKLCRSRPVNVRSEVQAEGLHSVLKVLVCMFILQDPKEC